MDLDASLVCEVDHDVLFEVVADLATYPNWLDIVGRAVPEGGRSPAWSVDLRGQLGPLRRSKRLRMERTVLEPASRVTFERRELDGRRHSSWVLGATISDRGSGGVELTMHLHYGGSLWVPMLDRVLRDEIERSKPRLVAEVARRA